MQEEIPNAQLMERRQLGIYYTPSEATQILCSWAIQDRSDLILEPSFGACGFLSASAERLKILNCSDPARHLFGCDIDITAFDQYLLPLFKGHGDLANRFFHKDFLKLDPEDFGHKFDAVIGNPPYVSHHNMTGEQKQTISHAISLSRWGISGRADLWAYFVLHSLNFLKEDGRMAWILPGSFLQADYAQSVHRALTSNFERVVAVQLGQKLFVGEGAKENTIVLLADRWMKGPSQMKVCFAPTLQDLRIAIDEWATGAEIGETFEGNAQSALLSPTIKETLHLVESTSKVMNLGNYCTVLIGIVTGANDFFLMTRDKAKELGIPRKNQLAILTKFSMAKGLVLGAEGPVRDYLATFNPEKKLKNRTFTKRKLWHKPHDGKIPDGYISYMHENGPRLILNDAKTTSTNTVHRIFFHSHIDSLEKKAVSLALLSSYAQLSAEIEGRAYGSGVLKHEPSAARRIKLLLPRQLDLNRIETLFTQVDCLLRVKDYASATDLIDEWAFSELAATIGTSECHQVKLAVQTTLKALRIRRHHPSLH
jgi:adenine-specific DNA-methyltransferase